MQPFGSDLTLRIADGDADCVVRLKLSGILTPKSNCVKRAWSRYSKLDDVR